MERFSGDSPAADATREMLVARFRERLDFFVFFHLGADARVEVRPSGERLHVRIAHQRVHPFQLDLKWDLVGEFAESAEAFEDYMLDLLTRHRRHQG